MKNRKFYRQEWFRMGNARKKWMKWRTPKGNQSKLRMHIKGKGWMPTIGYGQAKAVRGLHPSGLREVIVNNVKQLELVGSGKNYIVRMAAGVGTLKRIAIQEVADKMKIRVANPTKAKKKSVKSNGESK